MGVLVLGSSGMLGSMVLATLREVGVESVVGTQAENADAQGFFDARGEREALKDFCHSGDTVINCIGVTAPHVTTTPEDLCRALEINALFPQWLALFARRRNLRVIHMSTDGVFAPNHELRVETDVSDAADLYGKTKALGEATCDRVLTIRTSIVGPSPTGEGLLQWFLSQPEGGTVHGYEDVLWTGVTTRQFANLCGALLSEEMFRQWRDTSSVLHFVPNAPVSKFGLLERFRDTFRPDIKVIPVKSPLHMGGRVLKTKYPEWERFIGRSDLSSSLEELIPYLQ